MKKQARLLTLLSLVAAAHCASAADITGTITLKGTPPPEKPNDYVMADPNCGKLHKEAPKTKFYVVGSKGELADVVVSVKGLTGKSTGASAKPALVDQVGCEYTPYVSAIQTKQKLMVRNSDPIMHNVHPTPAVAGNKEANKAQLPKGPDLEFTFDNPEPFLRFKCDVHNWMYAYVGVFDHPYFSVTGKEGTFKIANVPPGKYTIEAAHRKGGTVTKEIEVKDGDVKLDFTIEAK